MKDEAADDRSVQSAGSSATSPGKPAFGLATQELTPAMYQELRRLAAARLRTASPRESIQATALVHEVFVRVMRRDSIEWKHDGHLFGVLAQAMRDELVDRARHRGRMKRGGDRKRVDLREDLVIGPTLDMTVLRLDRALTDLGAFDPDLPPVVMLRYFAGLTIAQTAESLGLSHATVERRWRFARAWLARRVLQDATDEE